MQDKTKKLLKKGLGLGAKIGLTTLILGGSFLLGFATGKATYQPKEDKSVSAANPKSALQPKRQVTNHLTGNPQEVHPNWGGYNSLYLNQGIESKYPNGQMQLRGTDIKITALRGNTSEDSLFDLVGINWGDGEIEIWGYDKQEQDDIDWVIPTDGYYDLVKIEATKYEWAEINLIDYQYQTGFELALDTIIKDVRSEEYFSPTQTSDWLSLFTDKGIGACLIENGTTYQGYPIGKYGIEISGEFLWVDRILPDFKDVKGNTSIQTDNYGTPVRTETDDQYDYLAGVQIYADGFQNSRALAFNTWAYNGTSIYNGKMPDYWGYPGLTDGSNVKIYHWGTMRTRANTYPNGESAFRDYFEYTRIIGGLTMKDFEPIIIGGDKSANMADVFTLIGSAFAGIAPFLAIQIIPSLTIGTLLLVPFIVTMVIVIIKMLRK